MPGSAAALTYGNRGGGWIPKPSERAPQPARDDSLKLCQTCTAQGDRLTYSEHSGVTCPCCLGPIEHHPDGDAGCWEGRARTARAHQQAGIPLYGPDEEALRRHPNPQMCGAQ